ncbi:hypothetical protein HAX54_006949, partial [Datura stramonium]|nr:hypothetical protein [Datura stramonium]
CSKRTKVFDRAKSEKGKSNESKRGSLKGPLRLVNGLASGRKWKRGLAGVRLTQS